MTTVCFSGRFDQPHVGHIIQIMRLGQQFNRVIIPVLDYEGQRYPVQYRVDVLREALLMAKGNYDVFSNKDHFAKIKKENCPKMDFYASGNMSCLLHMEQLGYKVIYVDRAYDYGATEEYKLNKIREVL